MGLLAMHDSKKQDHIKQLNKLNDTAKVKRKVLKQDLSKQNSNFQSRLRDRQMSKERGDTFYSNSSLYLTMIGTQDGDEQISSIMLNSTNGFDGNQSQLLSKNMAKDRMANTIAPGEFSKIHNADQSDGSMMMSQVDEEGTVDIFALDDLGIPDGMHCDD